MIFSCYSILPAQTQAYSKASVHYEKSFGIFKSITSLVLKIK